MPITTKDLEQQRARDSTRFEKIQPNVKNALKEEVSSFSRPKGKSAACHTPNTSALTNKNNN